MIECIRDVWDTYSKNQKIVILFLSLMICGGVLVWLFVPATQITVSVYVPETPPTTCNRTTIQFFYSDACPHCHNVMPFVKGIQENYTNVDVIYYEISNNASNAAIFTNINMARGIAQYGVPEVVVGKTVLIGDIEIPEKLEALIRKC